MDIKPIPRIHLRDARLSQTSKRGDVNDRMSRMEVAPALTTPVDDMYIGGLDSAISFSSAPSDSPCC
jgi:hypothetical protein